MKPVEVVGEHICLTPDAHGNLVDEQGNTYYVQHELVTGDSKKTKSSPVE